MPKIKKEFFFVCFIDSYLKKFHEIDVEISELLVEQVDSPKEVQEPVIPKGEQLMQK